MIYWRTMKSAPRDGTPFLAGIWVNSRKNASDSYTRRFEVHVVFTDDEGEIHPDCDCPGWGIDLYECWAEITLPKSYDPVEG